MEYPPVKNQTQPMKSLGTLDVESDNLSESDIDPFETIYGEMDEDSFHHMMEGIDWTYYPLFIDKEFLMKIGTNTHVLSHVLP